MDIKIDQTHAQNSVATIAGGNVTNMINRSALHPHTGLVDQLHRLADELALAQQRGELSPSQATIAQTQVAAARQEAEKANPDPSILRQYLEFVRSVVEGAGAVGGLATSLKGILEAIQTFR